MDIDRGGEDVQRVKEGGEGTGPYSLAYLYWGGA